MIRLVFWLVYPCCIWDRLDEQFIVCTMYQSVLALLLSGVYPINLMVNVRWKNVFMAIFISQCVIDIKVIHTSPNFSLGNKLWYLCGTRRWLCHSLWLWCLRCLRCTLRPRREVWWLAWDQGEVVRQNMSHFAPQYINIWMNKSAGASRVFQMCFKMSIHFWSVNYHVFCFSWYEKLFCSHIIYGWRCIWSETSCQKLELYLQIQRTAGSHYCCTAQDSLNGDQVTAHFEVHLEKHA